MSNLTPPPPEFQRFDDPEDFVGSLTLSHARYQTRVSADYHASVMRARFGDFMVSQGQVSTAVTLHGAIPDVCLFLLDTRPGADRVIDGRAVPYGTIYHPASNDAYLVKSSSHAAAWAALTIPFQRLSDISVALTGRDLAPSRSAAVISHAPRAALERMVRLSGRISRLAEHDPGRLLRPEVRRVVADLLGRAMTACLLDGRLEPDLAAGGRRRRIMTRLEEIGEMNAHEPLTLADLCVTLGVNARTLRLVAHEFAGMGPVQYLRMQRLNRARRALALADPRTASVGDIAGAFGFWESGRFAALYRSTFGETPMETLRRA